MAIAKRLRPWLLPLVFLVGYLFAWGTILVDRQMIIAEQAGLRRELKQAKKQLKLREMMLDFDDNWQQIVIWNEEAIIPEEGKWDPPKKK